MSLRSCLQNRSKYRPKMLLVDLHSPCSPCASHPLALRHSLGDHSTQSHALKRWCFIFIRYINDITPQAHRIIVYQTCSWRLVLIYCLWTHPCQMRPADLRQCKTLISQLRKSVLLIYVLAYKHVFCLVCLYRKILVWSNRTTFSDEAPFSLLGTQKTHCLRAL